MPRPSCQREMSVLCIEVWIPQLALSLCVSWVQARHFSLDSGTFPYEENVFKQTCVSWDVVGGMRH